MYYVHRGPADGGNIYPVVALDHYITEIVHI